MSQQTNQLQESQVTLPEEFLVNTNDAGVTVMHCPDCDYSSTNKHYLRQHTDLVHTNERPFKCPFCDYAGKRSHALKEHLIVHSDERPYKCTQCNAKFRKKGHLTNHNRMHSEAQTPLECFLCERKKFESRDDLYNHLRQIHINLIHISVFCCNRCNYATTIKGELHVHEMAHVDYRHVLYMKPKLPPSTSIILKCSDCGFETNQRKELEKHVLDIHFINGQKQLPLRGGKSNSPPGTSSAPMYKCTECGFVTSDHKQLLVHAYRHKQPTEKVNKNMVEVNAVNDTGVSNPKLTAAGTYLCTICSYYCDTQRALKAHMWKHSGHKNLQYPTFKNGPLSVYDDTPLAAKNFIDGNKNGRPSSLQYVIKHATQNHNAAPPIKTPCSTSSNNPVSATLSHNTKLAHNNTDRDATPKVVVQKLNHPENISGINCDRPLSSADNHIISNEEIQSAGTMSKIKPNTVIEEVVNHLQDEADDPLKVMTAVCEVAERHSVGEKMDVQTESKPRINPDCYSATEKTAATLLSLLRQGPNINPACPPAGYIYEPVDDVPTDASADKAGSDSSVLGGIAYEEVVVSEISISSDSGQASDTLSVDKPKTGICRSLLAVIEQLREGQSEDSTCPPGGRARRKRKAEDMDGKISEDVDVVLSNTTEEGDEVYVSTMPGVMYRCKPCHYRTSSSKKMQEHITRHKDNCDVDVLPSEFDSVSSAESAADGVVYRCKLCHYRSSVHLMRQHMKMHKNKKPHECSLCEFVANDNAGLQDHMIQHCKARQYQCKQCSAVFNYKSQLRAHTRVHEDGQAFFCEHCDYVTSYIDSFQDHLRVHSEVSTTFTCIACRQAFSDIKELQTHMKELCAEVRKLHRGNPLLDSAVSAAVGKLPADKPSDQIPRTLKCDQCEFVALSIRSLKSHLKRHVNDKRYIQQPLEQYKCNMCGYVCHHLPSLKSHMWRHAHETDFSYSFSDVLDETTPPLYKEGKPLITLRCCQCGFETLQKKELDTHMKSHWDIIKKTFDVGAQAQCD